MITPLGFFLWCAASIALLLVAMVVIDKSTGLD